jgi:hypothetical protein
MKKKVYFISKILTCSEIKKKITPKIPETVSPSSVTLQSPPLATVTSHIIAEMLKDLMKKSFASPISLATSAPPFIPMEYDEKEEEEEEEEEEVLKTEQKTF